MSQAASQALSTVAPEWRNQVWCKANLSYPINPHLTIDTLVDMLLKAAAVLPQMPFVWTLIDRPTDGSTVLVFLPPDAPLPHDGLQYMDQEQVHHVQLPGKTLECYESKLGFYPFQEPITSRVRRRFRISSQYGGNDGLWILQYLRSAEHERVNVTPSQARPQPPRRYPIPSVTSKPFRLFDVPKPAGNERKRIKGEVESEEINGDQLDTLTPREISRARYTRHHEWMEEVLSGTQNVRDLHKPEMLPPLPNKEELQADLDRLNQEIAELEQQNDGTGDYSRESEQASAIKEALQSLQGSLDTEERIDEIKENVDRKLRTRTVPYHNIRLVE